MTHKVSAPVWRMLVSFLLLFLALQPCAADAWEEDPARFLPGRWAFTVYSQAPGAEMETDAAFLTLEANGQAVLACSGETGERLCTLTGTWSCDAASDGTDQLTLAFTAADSPFPGELPMECPWRMYTEQWEEGSTLVTYLILEDDAGRPSPFSAFYGEQGLSPLALHREQGPNMLVVRCSSYVSLRAGRSTTSERLSKVPLGAQVLAFPEAGEENGFLLCVYEGEYGYILSSYLEPLP